MNTDPIADYLTRIRNAVMARKDMVEIPSSKMKKAITEILYNKGYILDYKFEDGLPGNIKIALKYHPVSKMSAISTITRASKPGLRKYASADELPRVQNGLGIAIVSTSKGVMTGRDAKKQSLGGEVLAYVW